MLAGAVALTVGLAASAARADTIALLDHHLPAVQHEPEYVFPSGDEMTDRMTELGNEIGHHMNLLSHDLISLQFDGRARHAKMRVGGGDDRFVTFAIGSDVQFVGTDAHVRPHLDLGFQDRHVHVDLPEFEIMPQSYQGDRVVVFLVPFFQRGW